MDPWQIDNVYVERSRLQVDATRATIAEMRSVMEESRRILARSQNLLRRIHQKEVPPQMPATTTYIVSVFEKPHWRTVLTTKDKAKALAERDRRQGAGRRDHAEGEEVLSGRIYIFQPTERLLPARCYHNDPRIGIIKGLVPSWPQFESAVSRKCPVAQRSRFWSRRQRTRRTS